MPPPPSHSDAGVPRWVLVAGLATVALCFGVAYHWGSVAEDDNAMVPINEITHRIKLTTRDALDCVKRRDSLYKKRVSAKTLNGTRVAEVNAAEKAYNEANALEQATLDNFTHCQDKTSELEVTAKHEAENARDQILALRSLDQQRRDLTAQIEALKKEDKGMRRNLLLDSLRQARENHLNLLHKLGEDVTLDEAYESELLAQYKPTHSSNITASNLARLINRDNITVEQFIARWSNFTYNASEHPKIFIPANNGPDTNATIERPKYFNREGTAPEVLGTVIGNITAPITTTAFAIKSLTTVAMCAYKHDNANLTFPNRFRRVDSRHRVELLNATVESPLVTFCRQCVSAVAQPAFRLACGKDKPNRLYGSYDFWAARSLIRPTPAAVDAARALYNSLGLAGRNVLGVAFKKSPQLALKCLHQRKPQRHYLWARALSNRSNDTLFEAVPGANRTEQCQPTIPTLFAAIDALRTKFKFDAVVVSVETKAEKEIVQNTEFGGAMQVVAIQPDSGFEDMTELLITSWANHILVNRFSDHSQVLTEMFALRNGIQAKKIHFF